MMRTLGQKGPMRIGPGVLVLLTFVFACLSAPAWSGQPLAVGVESLSYEPYYYIEDGEYRGYARELLDAFGAEYGYDITYVPLPVRRLYYDFLETRVLDFKFPDNSLWKSDMRRGVSVFYSSPLCEYTDGILVLPRNRGNGVKSLKVLGIIHGFDPWRHLPELDRNAVRLSENQSMAGLIGKGLVGRVDGIYANVAVVKYQLKMMGQEGQLVFDSSLPYSTSGFRMSTINRPDVMKQFNRFLAEQGELVKRLQEEYGVAQPKELSGGR